VNTRIAVLLLMLLASSPMIAHGEALDQQPRHTPGFPGSIYDEELLREILNMLNQWQGSNTGGAPVDQLIPPQTDTPGSGSQGQILPSFSDISVPSAELPSFPSVSAPSLPTPQLPGFAMPDPWLAALIATTVLVAVLITHFRGSIAGTIYSGLRKLNAPFRGRGLPRVDSSDPIALYWLGVEYVSRWTGLSKLSTDTHREYLSRIIDELNASKRNMFARLTECYELTRFAHEERSEVVEEAKRSFKTLVMGGED